MKIICVASTKGGTGKSTLCVTLAAYVQSLGQEVAVIDLDRGQGSATAWLSERAAAKHPCPELITPRALRVDLRRLAGRGMHYVFLDTPPTLDDSGVVEAAVEAATHILSPCRPSILDIGAAQTIANLAGETPLGFVLTDATTQWRSTNDSAAKALADIGHVFANRIAHRNAYVNAPALGRIAPEVDKAAAAEVAALWKEVARWMTK
jgi:chromosome partitioning protein